MVGYATNVSGVRIRRLIPLYFRLLEKYLIRYGRVHIIHFFHYSLSLSLMVENDITMMIRAGKIPPKIARDEDKRKSKLGSFLCLLYSFLR